MVPSYAGVAHNPSFSDRPGFYDPPGAPQQPDFSVHRGTSFETVPLQVEFCCDTVSRSVQFSYPWAVAGPMPGLPFATKAKES
jgi:hypothetical protein